MLDNQLIAEIIAIVREGLVVAGAPFAAEMMQSYQPTQEGVPSGPALFLHKVGDTRFGFVGRAEIYDEDNDVFIHREVQNYETDFQINSLSQQNPANINSITASDLVNRVAAILQSDSTIDRLQLKGIGILRVQAAPNPYFIDDKDRNEASPNFNFTLTHKQVIISETPIVDTIEYNINRV